MGEKLTLQHLVDLVTEKRGISKNKSDLFVRSFFTLIEQGLQKDSYVKIKGFGSFKLIPIERRESINVNTGERFIIEGHNKISFTPDSMLRDSVNKPFAHFETVVLNEGVDFQDLQTGPEQDERTETAVPVTDSFSTTGKDDQEVNFPEESSRLPEKTIEKTVPEAARQEQPPIIPVPEASKVPEKKKKNNYQLLWFPVGT